MGLIHAIADRTRPRRKRIGFFATAVPVFALQAAALACQESTLPPGGGRPYELDDGWETGALEDVGIAPDPLIDLVEGVRSHSLPPIHSVLIVRNGRLVFKSVTGLLVGLAIDQGCLPGPDASVLSFFPEDRDVQGQGKEGITLAHLLTMTSGLEWNEQDVFYDNVENDVVQLSIVEDPVHYVLSKPVVHPPASTWYYNGGGPVVLGEVVRQCSGERLDRYAQDRLFAPLGIDNVEWNELGSSDVLDAAGGLSLTPRDLARIGQLVLNGGTWRGTRIVSEEWVQAMTRRWVPLGPSQGYGFLWWTKVYPGGPDSVNAVMADGWGGQRIMVFPTLDLVVVFTAGAYTQQDPLEEIVSKFVLPAVVQP